MWGRQGWHAGAPPDKQRGARRPLSGRPAATSARPLSVSLNNSIYQCWWRNACTARVARYRSFIGVGVRVPAFACSHKANVSTNLPARNALSNSPTLRRRARAVDITNSLIHFSGPNAFYSALLSTSVPRTEGGRKLCSSAKRTIMSILRRIYESISPFMKRRQ